VAIETDDVRASAIGLMIFARKKEKQQKRVQMQRLLSLVGPLVFFSLPTTALELVRYETFRSVFHHKIALSVTLKLILIRSETFRSVLDYKIALSLSLQVIRS
jgi:hypothetical protein